MSIEISSSLGVYTLTIKAFDGKILSAHGAYNLNEVKIALTHFFIGHKNCLRKCPLCRDLGDEKEET